MNRTLTRAIERQITRDWHGEIPSLGIYRPRWLMRRAGPLLVGVCLDRDSGGDVYKPVFHVHFLGCESPIIGLTLATNLRTARTGAPESIQVRFHAERYRDAAARMVQQAPLPLSGDLRLAAVLDAYAVRIDDTVKRRSADSSVLLHRDCALIAAWAGDSARAEQALRACMQIRVAAEFRFVGGRDLFELQIREAIRRPDTIRQTVVKQVAAHALGGLPDANLLT